jgi:hypothetical protein
LQKLDGRMAEIIIGPAGRAGRSLTEIALQLDPLATKLYNHILGGLHYLILQFAHNDFRAFAWEAPSRGPFDPEQVQFVLLKQSNIEPQSSFGVRA